MSVVAKSTQFTMRSEIFFIILRSQGEAVYRIGSKS